MIRNRLLASVACVAILASLATIAAAQGDVATTRHGSKFVAESTLMEKTPTGKALRRIRTEYNWDDGLVYSYVHDADGKLLEVRKSYNGLRPDDEELAQAFALVWEDDEVQAIRRRQAGLDINGGFTYRRSEGACALPARCVQVFLFDAENVVKHMLVDLRSNRIVDRNFVPDRNLQGGAE